MSEWKECKLGALITLEYGKSLSNYQGANGKYPVYGTNGKIGDVDLFLSPIPSIIIGRKGAYRGVHYSPSPFFVIDTAFYVKPKSDNIDMHYLYNFMLTQDINAMDSGSAIPSTDRYEIYEIDIKLPPLSEQRAMASVLSSLDDKIDLLHRQNKTLEAMAETLFRQWFVEEAEEGWEEGMVLDYCYHYKNGAKPQNFPKDIFSHYSIPSFDNGMNPIEEKGAEIQSNKYIVVPNCLLFSKLNPHKDKRIWLILDSVGQNSVCSTEFQVIIPKNKKYLYFIYGWLSIPQNYNEIASGVGGTSGSHQRIDPADIFNFPCPKIDDMYIEQFHNKIEPLYVKSQKNRIQIRTLEKLRDTLLPKLMSGEVRVNV